MAGAPLPAVQAVLGHSTITVTMRYAHLAPNTLAAAVRAAGRSMQGDHGGERLELTDTTGKGCESAAHGSKTGEAGLLDLEIV